MFPEGKNGMSRRAARASVPIFSALAKTRNISEFLTIARTWNFSESPSRPWREFFHEHARTFQRVGDLVPGLSVWYFGPKSNRRKRDKRLISN